MEREVLSVLKGSPEAIIPIQRSAAFGDTEIGLERGMLFTAVSVQWFLQ